MRVFFGNYAPIFIILIKGVVGLVKTMNSYSAIMPPTKPAILTILTLSHRLRPSSQCYENSAMLEDLLLRP